MPHYKSYPVVANTPSRKQRKSQRRNVFAFNQAVAAEERRARRKARKEAKSNGSDTVN